MSDYTINYTGTEINKLLNNIAYKDRRDGSSSTNYQTISQDNINIIIPTVSVEQYNTYTTYLLQGHDVIIEVAVEPTWYSRVTFYHSQSTSGYIEGEVFYSNSNLATKMYTAHIRYVKMNATGGYYIKPGNTWHITLDSTRWRNWLMSEHYDSIRKFEDLGQEAVCTTTINYEWSVWMASVTGAVNAGLTGGDPAELEAKGITGGETWVDGLTATIAYRQGGIVVTPLIQIFATVDML